MEEIRAYGQNLSAEQVRANCKISGEKYAKQAACVKCSPRLVNLPS